MRKIRFAAIPLIICIIGLYADILCFAQDGPTPEEYEAYEKASQEKDATAKQKLILDFIQKYKKSTLDPNIAYEYAKIYTDYRARGAWQAMADAAERYLTHRPSDQASILAASESYQKLGNPQKLVAFGTKLYSQAPNANTAYFVAKAYQSLKDGPNFLTWAERTIKHDPNNLDMLTELITMYWQMQDMNQAATYAQRALQIVQTAKKPEGVTQEQWTLKSNQLKSFALGAIGEKAYVNNDVATAAKNFDAAVKANKRNDFAHYRLGFLFWRGGRTDEACMSFAKAFVLDGSTSQDARKQLYDLQQQTRGNTKGAAAIIQQARDSMK